MHSPEFKNPLYTTDVPPYDEALTIAEGNARRIRDNGDGSFSVLNYDRDLPHRYAAAVAAVHGDVARIVRINDEFLISD